MNLNTLIRLLTELRNARGNIPVRTYDGARKGTVTSVHATAGTSSKRWPEHGTVQLVITHD